MTSASSDIRFPIVLFPNSFFEKFDEILRLVLAFDLNSSIPVCFSRGASTLGITGETAGGAVMKFVRGREMTLQALVGEY